MTAISTADASATTSETDCPLAARAVAFADIPREAWDALLARTAAATPFSRWTFHRAWWDAYGAAAHEQYLVCVRADLPATAPLAADEIKAIVPLMHRHEVEPQDAATATAMRHPGAAPGAPVAPTAKAVFFGASYHADYATLLCDPADLPAVAQAVVASLAGPEDPRHGDQAWDVVDLRRLRDDDPALSALEAAFRAAAPSHGWTVERDREDVCPVVTLPDGLDWEDFLGTLDKHARHEIRRKIRRAEAAGPNEFRLVDPTPEAVDAFIELHQARWGERGLFPETEGGARSRVFVHRLAELERAEGSGRQLQLGHFMVGERVIFAGLGLFDGHTCFFYNAGMDPAARDLSPGVTGAAAYLRHAQGDGCRRFDFLRGDEAYKYEWGAVDEPIHRLLVRRTGDR